MPKIIFTSRYLRDAPPEQLGNYVKYIGTREGVEKIDESKGHLPATAAQKKLIATLLLNQTNAIDLSSLHQQNAVPPRVAEHLCRLLRLAILFASRRRDDLLPAIQLTAQDEQLTLILPGNWLDEHPLGREMVDQECQWQSYVHWILRVASGDTLK